MLLLWPTLWALFTAAGGQPEPLLLWIFILGTVLMRSAGCIVNDLADRKLDALVERTKNRPLVTGEISVKEAWICLSALTLYALYLVWALDNMMVLWLSLAAVLVAATYPLAKRWLSIPQAHLGIAFSWGILMAYAAVLDSLTHTAWWLFVANYFWIIAYDTQYAMVDRADDLRAGIKSSAIFFGRFDVAVVMLCYAAMLAILSVAGYYLICWQNWQSFRWLLAALLLAALFVGYQYKLIRRREPQSCIKAFRYNNWIGLIIFIGLLLALRLP